MYNKVIMMGRLTGDPKIYKKDQDGETKISASYNIAVQRNYSREHVDFFRCVVFGKAAEFVQNYLKKGMKILVEGAIYTDSYTNTEGHKTKTAAIYVERHVFCEKRQEEKEFGDVPEEELPPAFYEPETDIPYPEEQDVIG